MSRPFARALSAFSSSTGAPPWRARPAALWAFLQRVGRRYRLMRSSQVAGSLAFTTLLSLVPMVTVGLVILSKFPVFNAVAEALRGFLLENLLPQKAGEVIAKYTLQFTQKAAGLTLLGSLLLFVTAFMTMQTVDRAFNQIWQVARNRAVLQRVLVYWVLLTLGPLALGASLAATSYVVSASLGWVEQASWLRGVLLRGLSWIVLAALFGFLYFAVPNRQVAWRSALIGGLAAGAGFLLMQRLFGWYLVSFPSYTLIYGAFAVVPIFLLWLYLSWSMVLIGALIAAELDDPPTGVAPLPDFPGREGCAAMLLLAALAQAQAESAQCTVPALAGQARLDQPELLRLLQRMEARRWVVRTEQGGWVLLRRVEDIRWGEVVEAFLLDLQGWPAVAGSEEWSLREGLAHALAEAPEAARPVTAFFGARARPPAAKA